jgi:hypothetical protein
LPGISWRAKEFFGSRNIFYELASQSCSLSRELVNVMSAHQGAQVVPENVQVELEPEHR